MKRYFILFKSNLKLYSAYDKAELSKNYLGMFQNQKGNFLYKIIVKFII